MDVIAVLQDLGGVGRRHQLLARGISDRQLLGAARAGVIVRPRRGCYALPHAPFDALRARHLSAQLTCVSALAAWGLPAVEPASGMHLAVPVHRGIAGEDRRRRDDVRWHRVASASDDLWCPPAMVVDHLGLCSSFRAQLAAADAALHRGLFSVDDLVHFTSTTGLRRIKLLTRVDGRSQSPAETLVRDALRDRGLKVESQRLIPFVGHVDLWVEDRLVVEVDGYAFHSSKEAFAEDRRRDNALTLSGISFLRFPAAMALAEPDSVAAQVEAALGSR